MKNESRPSERFDFDACMRWASKTFVTKDDLKRLATKEELREMRSEIVGKIDGFMAQVGKTDRAQIIADWRLSELEKRVTAVESRPS
jgi:hypothetical protein